MQYTIFFKSVDVPNYVAIVGSCRRRVADRRSLTVKELGSLKVELTMELYHGCLGSYSYSNSYACMYIAYLPSANASSFGKPRIT